MTRRERRKVCVSFSLYRICGDGTRADHNPVDRTQAKLRIHDPALNYLKEMFGSHAPMSQDQLIQTKEEEETMEASRSGAGNGQRGQDRGRVAHNTHHDDSEF